MLAPLCDVEETILAGSWNPFVLESDLHARTAQSSTSVLFGGNGLSSGLYLLSEISHAVFVIALGFSVVIDRISNQLGAEDGPGKGTGDVRVQNWENVHACSRNQTRGYTCVYSPPENRCACGRASACEAGVGRERDVSSRGGRTSSLTIVVGFETLSWTSCNTHGWARRFDSSGVSLMMVSPSCSVSTCQSLACPATLGLCCVPAPPPSNPSAEIVKPSVCGPDFVRAGALGRGRPASGWDCDLWSWSPSRSRGGEVAIAIFSDVILLDQLCLGLVGRLRCPNCLSWRHTGPEMMWRENVDDVELQDQN